MAKYLLNNMLSFKSIIHKLDKAFFTIACLLFFVSSCSSGGDDDKPNPLVDNSPPSAPSSLTSSQTTENSTLLSWNASSDNIGVKDYSVFQNDAIVGSSISTSYTAINLISGTEYSFKVKANDNAGNSSAFSNTANVTTNSSQLQIASGNIEDYVSNIIDNAPSSGGDNYAAPTTTQLETSSEVVNAILTDDVDEAVLKSGEIGYQITEFTDTSLSPNKIFYIIEKKSQSSNFWGTYIFNKNPDRGDLIIMAPHSKYDTNTGKEAVYCFKNSLARAVFINGTHRCNSEDLSSCSGSTSACGTSEPFRISDMAHTTTSMFQGVTKTVFNSITSSVFIQLHGFSKQASDPFVIMSNGTRETPSTDYATLIKDALLVEDNSLTFKLAHIDTDWTRLIGFTNTQGRFINNSSDACNEYATSTTGRFIHIEQEKSKLRDDVTGWSKMGNALKNVFN
jgi:chitodextrinase